MKNILSKYWGLGVLMVVHLGFLTNLQFTLWPEMMSYPYFLNNGFRLYSDFIHPYTPLLTWMLAGLYKIFGYKLAVAQILTWGLLLVNDVLIFLIVRRLTKKDWIAMFSVLFYVVFQPILEGNMIWFDVVVVTPLLLTFFYLLDPTKASHLDGQSYLWAGVALGIACLVKQTAGLFLISAAFYAIYSERKLAELRRLFLGPVVLGLGLLGYVWTTGSFGDFMNWTLVYPFTEWGNFPGYVDMALNNQEKTVLIMLAIPVFFVKIKRKEELLWLLFLVGGLVSVYPRFSWFHMQSALAFLVVGYGLVLVRLGKTRGAIFGVLWLLVIIILFMPDIVRRWGREARFVAASDWQKAELIREFVPLDKQVYLLGLQSGYYPMSGRLSPVPWTDNFGWYLEIDGVQEGILESWGEQELDYVIWREPGESESELGRYQPEMITNWVQENYNRGEEIWERTYLWERK